MGFTEGHLTHLKTRDTIPTLPTIILLATYYDSWHLLVDVILDLILIPPEHKDNPYYIDDVLNHIGQCFLEASQEGGDV